MGPLLLTNLQNVQRKEISEVLHAVESRFLEACERRRISGRRFSQVERGDDRKYVCVRGRTENIACSRLRDSWAR